MLHIALKHPQAVPEKAHMALSLLAMMSSCDALADKLNLIAHVGLEKAVRLGLYLI